MHLGGTRRGITRHGRCSTTRTGRLHAGSPRSSRHRGVHRTSESAEHTCPRVRLSAPALVHPRSPGHRSASERELPAAGLLRRAARNTPHRDRPSAGKRSCNDCDAHPATRSPTRYRLRYVPGPTLAPPWATSYRRRFRPVRRAVLSSARSRVVMACRDENAQPNQPRAPDFVHRSGAGA